MLNRIYYLAAATHPIIEAAGPPFLRHLGRVYYGPADVGAAHHQQAEDERLKRPDVKLGGENPAEVRRADYTEHTCEN
jgi:hypothetical protein